MCKIYYVVVILILNKYVGNEELYIIRNEGMYI